MPLHLGAIQRDGLAHLFQEPACVDGHAETEAADRSVPPGLRTLGTTRLSRLVTCVVACPCRSFPAWGTSSP